MLGVIGTTEAQASRESWVRRSRRWMWQFIKAERGLVFAIFVLLAFYIIPGVFADQLAPYDYRAIDVANKFQGPSWEHWFGTDSVGRDLFSRDLHANQTLIGISLAVILAGSLFVPAILGMLTAIKGGRVDSIVGQAGQFTMMLPGLLIMILINATVRSDYDAFMREAMASPGFLWFAASMPLWLSMFAICMVLAVIFFKTGARLLGRIALGLGSLAFLVVSMVWMLQLKGFVDYLLIFMLFMLISWYPGTRLIRSISLRLREMDFVRAANVMGASTWWQMTRHFLPNVMGFLVLSAAGTLAMVALLELSLSLLGFGVNAPTPSYGLLIEAAQSIQMMRTADYLVLIPAARVVAYILTGGYIAFQMSRFVQLKR